MPLSVWIGFVLLAGAWMGSFSAQAASSSPLDYITLLEKSVDLQALYLPPGFMTQMFSSYDRDGGDRDGQGYLRKEGDWYIIAEMQGPGAISRIWSMAPAGMIRVYVDQGSSPLFQLDFRDLFLGKNKPFISPFVSASKSRQGAYTSYLPIPYTRLCKVAVQELGYYQIEYVTFPPKTTVVPFSFPFSRNDEKRLAAAASKFAIPQGDRYKNNRSIEANTGKLTLAAGERISLCTLEGPAVIRGMRMQWQGDREENVRDLVIRCYWEGEREPSVLVPLYDFFGGGVQTLALGRDSEGGWYCYFPMPFQNLAAIEIENSSERCRYTLDFQLAIQRKVQLPKPLRTFHAEWRRDNETPIRSLRWDAQNQQMISEGDENFLALSAEGPGHVVGWELNSSSFFESDVMLLIVNPNSSYTVPGTGQYGFFDLAGEIQSVEALFAGSVKDSKEKNFLFRSFLSSPIEFEQSVYLTLEHGSGNALRKDYTSTAYWYQEKNLDRSLRMLPPGARRFRTFDLIQPVIELGEGVPSLELPIEAETLSVNAVQGIYDPQDMLPYGPDWSGNQQMRFDALQVGGSVVFDTPPLDFSGWYTLRCRLTGEPNGAVVAIKVNDQKIASKIDLYSSAVIPKIIDAEDPVFLHASESPNVRFLVVGQNSNSEGLVVGVDSLQWIPIPTPPDTLDVLGPFAVAGDPERTIPHAIQTVDEKSLIVGYKASETDELNSIALSPDKKTGRFDLGNVVNSSTKKEGVCLVTWTIVAERTGIYSFELENASLAPFFSWDESAQMIPLNHRLIINDILMTGRDEFRYDPVDQSMLPTRYRIPLQEGENRLSWLIQCNPKTWIRPVLGGVIAKTKSK